LSSFRELKLLSSLSSIPAGMTPRRRRVRRQRTLDDPNHVDGRDKPGHQAFGAAGRSSPFLIFPQVISEK